MTENWTSLTFKTRAGGAAPRPTRAHRRASLWAGVCQDALILVHVGASEYGRQAGRRPEVMRNSDLYNFKV